MRRLVEYDLPGGGSLLVEVEEAEGLGPRPSGIGGRAIEHATMGLDKAVAKLRPLAELLLAEVRALTHQPD